MFFTRISRTATAVLYATIFLFGAAEHASAITVAQAQVCANKLIEGYRTKKAPIEVFDILGMARKTVGPDFNGFSPNNQQAVMQAVQELTRAAFKETRNRFENVQSPNVRGKTVTVHADIFQGSTGKNFPNQRIEAFVSGAAGCGIWEVRVAQIFNLSTTLKEGLMKHRLTRNIMNSRQK